MTTHQDAVISTDATAKLQELWIPWQQFVHSQTTGAATTLVAGGVGAPVSSGELESADVGGLFLDAATDTIGVLIPVPYDLDVTESVAFEAPMQFGAATAAGDSITLNLEYGQFTAATTALAEAATAASPDFGALAWAAASAIHVATGATIAANTLVLGRYLLLQVVVGTLTAFSASEVAFLGLKMIYTKRHL